jgi:hypothetical protein
LISGWAVLCVLGVLCAVSGARLTLPAIAIGIVGVAGYFLSTNAAAGATRLGLAWLLLLPLIAIASVIPATMFDEFPYLLPNAKTLVLSDIFPDRQHPNVWSSKPDYPPALPLIGYVGARFGGIDVAYPAKVFVVLLAGAFGLALADLIVSRVGILAAVAIGVALASVLNPFFDPRNALSSYTDTPTGFVLALGIAASWRALHEPGRRWILQAASASVVLITLRETNLVFVAALAIGLFLCGRLKLAVLITLPSFVMFGLWRLYMMTAGWSPSMSARPLDRWDWSAPLIMMRALFGDRLANNPVLGIAGGMLALVSALLFIWIIFRSSDKKLRALLILAGTVAAAWVAFLAWAFIAVFTDEVHSANSAWRYLSQLGPLFIYAIVATLAQILPARVAIKRTRPALAIGAIACLVPLLLPLATSAHWRIDCRYPDVAVLRHAIEAIKKLPIGSEKIAIIHPADADMYTEVLDYELGRPVRSAVAYKRAEQAEPGGYRLDLAELDRKRLIQDGQIPTIKFTRWDGSAWTPVFTLDPERPRACGAKPFEKWEPTQNSR